MSSGILLRKDHVRKCPFCGRPYISEVSKVIDIGYMSLTVNYVCGASVRWEIDEKEETKDVKRPCPAK